MNRILARTLAVAGTAATILAVTAGAASAGEREECSDIAVCANVHDLVNAGDVHDVLNILDGHHHR